MHTIHCIVESDVGVGSVDNCPRDAYWHAENGKSALLNFEGCQTSPFRMFTMVMREDREKVAVSPSGN